MTTSRVAVLGSCVTRDVWNHAGPPDSHPMLFIGRTSLASLTLPDEAASQLAPLISRLPDLPGFAARSIRAELAKDALDQIAAIRPSVLVIDFIDERFDLLDAQGVLLNESLELIESGLPATVALAAARRVARLSQQAWQLWERGLLRLRQAWDQQPALAGCRILLHASYWAEDIVTGDRRERLPDTCEILLGRLTSRAAHNALLRRYHECFQQVFPEATVITPPAALRVADAAHRWGPAPFHFIDPYYHAFASAAAAAGVALWDQQVTA
ncbi:DUF6270 domain-containing protein [Neoroseomonas soli]|uniref:Uncharacterized protein n=1 Tax=Neoroseomonas soli TaxID=1081025 RepID=A0A9X9X352_9PROT|nr:DUF6270 domain-containing protein [Neoroseomonas soli]MBR0673831.1 hypothetical protein [Neoroseomonas soli]